MKFPSLGSIVSIAVAKSIVVDIYAMDAAMGTYTNDPDYSDMILYSDVSPDVGDFCLLTKIELGANGLTRTAINGLYTIQKSTLLDPTGAKYHVWFDKDIPVITDKGCFEITFLKGPEDKSRAVLGEVDATAHEAKCKYRYDDIFTADYWVPSDGSYLLKCAYKDEYDVVVRIVKYVKGHGYNTGTLLYWPETKSVYRVVKPISGSESESELKENGAIVPYMYTVADIEGNQSTTITCKESSVHLSWIMVSLSMLASTIS